MSRLFSYAKVLVEKSCKSFVSGEVFAKVLTPNDDSGRHGVLIPSDAYSYFPNLSIPDPTQNATEEFLAFDTIAASMITVAYKYYKRYPERRITRLSGILNDRANEPRLLIFIRAKHTDGSFGYYFDCANSAQGGRFGEIFHLIFGGEIAPDPGTFIVRPVDSDTFSVDPVLSELLGKFDEVKERGWIDTLRSGDTGIGYTFETLIGIEENNEQIADFKGIEIKCKGIKEGKFSSSSKFNLFQAGPKWSTESTMKERIRVLGTLNEAGLFACYSQVTTTPNNIGLLLDVLSSQSKIDLRKNVDTLGHWSFERLEKRLIEKHERAVFVKAKSRNATSKTQYAYEELVYCDKPSIERFVQLIVQRNLVFEFTMHEKPNGSIRNHGYPWRLSRNEFLDQLFAFQIKLR